MSRTVVTVAALLAIAVLITVLAGLVPDPAAKRWEIPGHQRTTVVECEQR